MKYIKYHIEKLFILNLLYVSTSLMLYLISSMIPITVLVSDPLELIVHVLAYTGLGGLVFYHIIMYCMIIIDI